MTPYLWLVLVPMMGLVARDALRDHTPRSPRTPERSWWTRKRTARERLVGYIRIGK